jgi:single-strand DNA-binding protein
VSININYVNCGGRLVRDPESRKPGIANFTIVTSRKYKAGDGTLKEDSAFVDCTAFGFNATFVMKLKKMDEVIVEGRLHLSSWSTQDGQKRQRLDVTCDRVHASRELGTHNDGDRRGEDEMPTPAPTAAPIDDEPPF